MADATQDRWQSWAIVELMGHVRIAGQVSEEERFGVRLGRIDIPGPDGATVTQYFGGQSIYRLTPCDEATARRVAAGNSPAPVHAWSLPAPETITPTPDMLHRAGLADRDPEDEDFDDDDRDPDDIPY